MLADHDIAYLLRVVTALAKGEDVERRALLRAYLLLDQELTCRVNDNNGNSPKNSKVELISSLQMAAVRNKSLRTIQREAKKRGATKVAGRYIFEGMNNGTD